MDYCVISVDKDGNITTLVECMHQTEYDEILASVDRLQKGDALQRLHSNCYRKHQGAEGILHKAGTQQREAVSDSEPVHI